MFVVTSIVTLRERRSGTLSRLMTMPISKFSIIFGYAISFTALALLQAVLATFVTTALLGVKVAANIWMILGVAALSGFLGTSLGLFVSAFATSEFQAVQFLPAIIFPQLLTCGLFVPRIEMARALQLFADIAPLTYCVDAMAKLTTTSGFSSTLTKDVLIVFGVSLLSIVLAGATVRRSS